MKINVGDRVKDTITGFEGIAIGRTEWINGCVRIVVQAENLKEGVPVPPEHIDEPQLKLIKAGVKTPTPITYPDGTKKDGPGGPRPAALRQPDAKR